MIDLSHFEPNTAHELCDTIDGVDAAFLADLYDCVSKFGNYYQGKQMRSLSRDEPTPLSVAVVVDVPGNLNMNISRGPGGILRNRLKTILLSGTRSCVFWDGDITAEEVRELIRATDAEMAKTGFEEDGSRRQTTPDDEAPTKLEVDKVFRDLDVVYIVPDDLTPEQFRAEFDRPEELHLVKLNNGCFGFVHKKNSRLVKIADATAAILARHGITDPDQLRHLPQDAQERIYREIQSVSRPPESGNLSDWMLGFDKNPDKLKN